jgi:hypothetical protein
MTYRCSDGHDSTDPDYCSVCGAPVSAAPAASEVAPAPPPPPAAAPITISPPAGAGSGGPGSGGAGSGGPGSGGTRSGGTVSIGAMHPCPNCGTDNEADALFCESCGYDFTTGSLPPPPDPTIVPVPPSTTTAPPHGAPPPSSPSSSAGAAVAPAPSGWVAEVWIDPEWYAEQPEPTDPCPTPGAPRVVSLPVAGALIGRPSARQKVHPEIDCSPDSAVSRRHAQLTLSADRWYLEDLGSTNGTFVAGVADPLPTDPVRQRHELADDERVYVGAWTRIQLRRATDSERGSGA